MDPSTQNDSALDRQVGGDHYLKYRIQPKEFFHANGIPHMEAVIMEYVLRWRDKGGVQDLEKAKHMIDLLIELEAKEAARAALDETAMDALRRKQSDISDEP